MLTLEEKLNEAFFTHHNGNDDPYCVACGAPWTRLKNGATHYHLTDVTKSVFRMFS